jgi:hypothetical protein
MSKQPAQFNPLIIIRKDEIEALLTALKQERQELNTSQQPQPLNPAAYNDYRWLIKAEENEDLGRNS